MPSVLARVLSAALVGVEAALVRVEVDVSPGLPNFTTVGLPDSTVRESRERVRTAIRNVGYASPLDRITVNLAPADLRKEGAAFDLPIALGILAATGCVRDGAVGSFAVVGELALDGQIQPVQGSLAVALACRRRGIGTLLVPCANGSEAAAVTGLRVVPAGTLGEAVALLNGEAVPSPPPVQPEPRETLAALEDDFGDVVGQAHAKRALDAVTAPSQAAAALASAPEVPGGSSPQLAPTPLRGLLTGVLVESVKQAGREPEAKTPFGPGQPPPPGGRPVEKDRLAVNPPQRLGHPGPTTP
jgi:magnesium chelatase family protein